LIAGKARSLP
jgi:hypothetical protein